MFVAVAMNAGAVQWSSDGITLYGGANIFTENNAFTCVCWSPEMSMFLALSYTGGGGQYRVMTSDIAIPNINHIRAMWRACSSSGVNFSGRNHDLMKW